MSHFSLTSHFIKDISEKILFIKMTLEEYYIKLPSFVVTDNSWALIGASLYSLNGQDATAYVNWCFQVLITHANDKNINELRSLVSIRHLICFTHFLKNGIKDLKVSIIFNKDLQIIFLIFTS